MFDRVSRPTITESVEESADPAVESPDSTTDSAKNPLKIGLWVRAFTVSKKVSRCPSSLESLTLQPVFHVF